MADKRHRSYVLEQAAARSATRGEGGLITPLWTPAPTVAVVVVEVQVHAAGQCRSSRSRTAGYRQQIHGSHIEAGMAEVTADGWERLGLESPCGHCGRSTITAI